MTEIGTAIGEELPPPAPSRYELRPVGVFDRELGTLVLPTDPAWLEYQSAIASGAAPDPAPQPARQERYDQVLADQLARVENIAFEVRFAVVGNASAAEMASWTEKLRQARVYDTAAMPSDADAPMLATEAQERGVTTADIVARVLANASAYSDAEARIAGISGRHKDALRALTTVPDLLAYDINAGWPGRASAPPSTPPDIPQAPPLPGP